MSPTDDEHHCPWRARVEASEAEVEDLKARMSALERFILGKKSESMPPKDREVKKGEPSKRNGKDA